MISCTEFIPLYSEFFKFLESQGGHDAVMRYWDFLGDKSIGDATNPNSLLAFLERDKDNPLLGAWRYWSHTLTEEACDLIRIYNPAKGYIYLHMRHCPSRGMLNELEHVEPYYDYCGHCDVIYAPSLAKYGIVSEALPGNLDNAECASIMYLKEKRPDCEFTHEALSKYDDTMLVMDITREDNKYLHRDFHLSGDTALKYCGDNYGENCARAFLATYATHYYSPQIEDAKKRGLIALKEWIEHIYETEEASDVLHTELDGDESLTVTIDKSPVIEYMHSLHQEPSRYYIEQTRTLYSAVADACNLGFTMEYYNEDGGTRFRFFKRHF